MERPESPAEFATARRRRRLRLAALVYLALGLIFALAVEVPYAFQPGFTPVATVGLVYMAPFLAVMWPFWLLVRLLTGARF